MLERLACDLEKLELLSSSRLYAELGSESPQFVRNTTHPSLSSRRQLPLKFELIVEDGPELVSAAACKHLSDPRLGALFWIPTNAEKR